MEEYEGKKHDMKMNEKEYQQADEGKCDNYHKRGEKIYLGWGVVVDEEERQWEMQGSWCGWKMNDPDESKELSLIICTASCSSLEVRLLSFCFFFSASHWVMDTF